MSWLYSFQKKSNHRFPKCDVTNVFEFNDGCFEAAMDQLRNRFFSNKNIISDVFKNSAKYPKTDIKVNDDGFVFNIAIPGLKKDDIEITFDKNILTIKYDKKENKEESSDKYILKELRHSSFIRSWEFQDEIKEEEIEASTKYGILTIKLPSKTPEKNEQNNVKKIDIKDENETIEEKE
jgi:HSP20 family protein